MGTALELQASPDEPLPRPPSVRGKYTHTHTYFLPFPHTHTITSEPLFTFHTKISLPIPPLLRVSLSLPPTNTLCSGLFPPMKAFLSPPPIKAFLSPPIKVFLPPHRLQLCTCFSFCSFIFLQRWFAFFSVFMVTSVCVWMSG